MGISAEKRLAENKWLLTVRRCSGGQILAIVIIFLVLQGCAQKAQVTYNPQQKRTLGSGQSVANTQNVLLLKRHFEKWRGTPYVDGGMTASGVDCSGFTVLAYRDLFGLSLPRTAGEQAESGHAIARAALKTGDLVFFQTGRWKKHVGIYLADDQFIHASLSKGVTLSSLDDSYWQTKYWQARRLQSPTRRNVADSRSTASYRR